MSPEGQVGNIYIKLQQPDAVGQAQRQFHRF